MDELFNKLGRAGAWVLSLPTLWTGVVAVLGMVRSPNHSLEVAAPFFFFLGFFLSCVGLASVDRDATPAILGSAAGLLAAVAAAVVLVEQRRTTDLFFSLVAASLGCLQLAKQYTSGG
jgi:hypothetical protein